MSKLHEHEHKHTDDKLCCEKLLILAKHKGEEITDEIIEAEVKEEIIEKLRKNSKEENQGPNFTKEKENDKEKLDVEKELHNIKVYENALYDLGVPEAIKTTKLEHKDVVFDEYDDNSKDLELEIKEVKKCERALHEIERNEKENFDVINMEKLKIENEEKEVVKTTTTFTSVFNEGNCEGNVGNTSSELRG
jgi:hypothetical protein